MGSWKAVVAAAVVGAVCLFIGSASASPSAQIHPQPRGVIPHAGVHPAARAAGTSGSKPSNAAGETPIDPNLQLTYHGGPVMHSHTLYLIFWVPGGYSLPANYASNIEQYVQDVAADSGTTSNPYGAISQYTSAADVGISDPGGPASYDVTYGGAATVTDAFPSSGCPVDSAAVCMTDGQLQTELANVLSDQGWARDYHREYALILPDTVKTCFDNTDDACSGFAPQPVFCAYHSAFGDDAVSPVIYLDLPFENASSCHNNSAIVEPTPNGQADVLIDDLSHEEREAATDPVTLQTGPSSFIWGWSDAQGNEADDKCIDVYGSLLGSTYTQLINQHSYATQTEWSNAKHGCYQMGAPVISNVFGSSGVQGDTITLTGQNFFGGPSSFQPTVKFGAVTVPAVDAVVNAAHTQITVTLPAGNTTGKVTVTGVGGIGTSAQTFSNAPGVTSLSALNGQAGDLITVTGTGFFGVKSVTFNGVKGVFKNVATNGTTLQVVIPLAATDGFVSVTTVGGTGSSSSGFTVLPKITSFTPASAKGGANVTINGSGFGALTSVDFAGSAGATVQPGNTANKIVVQVPSDATVGPLTVHANADVGTATPFKPLPSIASLSVVDGVPGDQVHVTGMNLLGATTVKFGTISAGAATTVTATGFDTTVPGPPFSSGAVSVVTPAGTALSTQIFQLTAVTSFTPAKAASGATVTITGRGLSDAQTVAFGNHPGVVPTARTATSLKVVVPPDEVDGLLTVNMPDGANPTTALPFKPLPRIVSFDHPSYHAGIDTVTVTGTNLQVAGPVSGKLGSVAITPTSVTPTSFQFVVPANAVTGTVSFTDAAGPTVSTAKVNVVPTITGDPNPNNSTVGSKITISGKTFTGTTSVTFGADTHKAAIVVGAGGTTLTVTVPATALSGKITVTNAGGSTQTSHNFAVDPFVKSFIPTSGPTGTQITVTGTGFTGANDVSWPGGDAVPTNVTSTSLKVVVPPGAATGGIQVFTNVAGVDAFSEPSNTAFTVTMSARITTPIHGDYGSAAHFSGTGLAGVTEVDFNGLPGTNVSPSLDGQSLTVDAPASGSITGAITLKAGSTTITAGGGDFTLLNIDHLSRYAGVPGSTMTITGTGFTGASDVTFGGAESGGFTVDSDTQITVTVPSGETGTVSVVNGGGTANAPSSFTIETLSGVSINEVRTDASGFIELYNSTGSTLDLTGAKIVFRPAGATDSSTDVVEVTFPQNSPITSHGFSELITDSLNTTGGGLALELPNGTIVTKMGYGTATNAFVTGAAAPAPMTGDSIARSPDGASSNDDGDDFKVTTTPTPDSANTITAPVALNVSKGGTGSGTVTSDVPPQIDCGSTCTTHYESGTVVTVTASPAGGSSFTQWSGGPCNTSSNAVCTFTITADTSMTAIFGP